MDGVRLASNGINFMPNFMKICQVVKTLEEDKHQRQHGDVIRLLSLFKK
jgi:hypothetical protein